MKALTLSPTLPFLTFSPPARRRAYSSRVNASRSTATSGPLPDRKTACVGSFSSRRRVAIFSPTRVLPAPRDRTSFPRRGWAEVLHRLGGPSNGVPPRLYIHERCARLVECLP